ncbi:hypothetical protein [Boudabousia marimammalium]|uniref:Uncharacterized protein n=1 Tax=Boudabousia marimammalium TaxID=156892 RepID=A0A1Q5PSQ2_9ACTO|nr:hypothetical protein [Boudabousia marimammalium]OKL50472.1 hypothetical protein BM477_00410 [Boudabousia marimammalium]
MFNGGSGKRQVGDDAGAEWTLAQLVDISYWGLLRISGSTKRADQLVFWYSAFVISWIVSSFPYFLQDILSIIRSGHECFDQLRNSDLGSIGQGLDPSLASCWEAPIGWPSQFDYFSILWLFIILCFVISVWFLTRLKVVKATRYAVALVIQIFIFVLQLLVWAVFSVVVSGYEVKFVVLACLGWGATLFLIVLIFPFGSGYYSGLLQNLRYMLFTRTGETAVGKPEARKIAFIVISAAVLAVVLHSLSGLNYVLVLFLLLAIVLSLYQNSQTGRPLFSLALKTLVFFSLVSISILLAVFTGKTEATGGLVSALGVFVSVYLAVERLMSISKDITSIVREYSVLFYAEIESDFEFEEKKVAQRYIDVRVLSSKSLEHEIVIQLTIRALLLGHDRELSIEKSQIKSELFHLKQLYSDAGYLRYKMHVDYTVLVSAQTEFATQPDSKEKAGELLKELEKILKYDKQELFPVHLFGDYCELLEYLGDSKGIVDFYEDFGSYWGYKMSNATGKIVMKAYREVKPENYERKLEEIAELLDGLPN